MTKKNLTAALAVILLIFFSNCKRDEDIKKQGTKLGDIRLSAAEQNTVPYHINDSLIFKDSLENTQIFTVRSQGIHSPRVYRHSGADAFTDYYDVEELYVELATADTLGIWIHLRAPLPAYLSPFHTNKNLFSFTFYIGGMSQMHSVFRNYIDPTAFYYTDEGMSIPFHNSITFSGHTFNAVYELTYTNSSTTNDYVQTVYYSLSEGIIGYKSKAGVKWFLYTQ